MTDSTIPQNYQEWHHTITVKCGLKLTPDFIETRVAALQNENDSYTQQFINLYGREYLEAVISWFLQAGKSA